MPDLDVLWEPVQVGGVTLPNRIVVTAHVTGHGTSHTQDDGMTDRYIGYVAERARGGAGLVMPGGVNVHPQGSKITHMGLWGSEAPQEYRRLAEAVHRHGESKVFIQLFHPGPQDNGFEFLENQHVLLAASAMPSQVYGRIPKAMEQADIDSAVAAYGRAAAMLRDVGIDGIELSSGHGYLLHSFFSPLTNRRTDQYGGDVAGRCRFILEILAEIRAQAGRDFPVSVRLSFDDYLGGAGIVLEDALSILGEIHAARVVDMFSVSAGTYPTIDRMIPPTIANLGAANAMSAKQATSLVDGEAQVLIAAGVRTIDLAAQLVRDGHAHLVGMARAHLADPYLVAKAQAGRAGEIRRCTGANQGCTRRVGNRTHLTCTVNPAAGREAAWGGPELPQAATALNVLVIGGGPAGLKAAEAAASRGHVVTLVEREAELGGMLRHAGRLPGRSAWQDTVDDLVGAVTRLGVTVRLGEAMTAAAVAAEGADRVVVATGARYVTTGFSSALTPMRDAIPGAELAHVVDPLTALADSGALGDRVVVLDDTGDLLPLALALVLHEAGKEVEVVTAKLHAGTNILATLEWGYVYPRLKLAGVTITEQTIVTSIEEGSVGLASLWGVGEPRSTAADSVVLVTERETQDELFHELEAAGVAVDRIGDCVAPREVDEAIYDGYRWGRELGEGGE